MADDLPGTGEHRLALRLQEIGVAIDPAGQAQPVLVRLMDVAGLTKAKRLGHGKLG